ncbi:MAG: type II secretion system major pseudopilin GspG [Caulobacterales bacterium]|jgi:general secretion pathway protein G
MRHNQAGYTLTEMLVVIVIISLIAAVMTPALLSQLSRARAKAARLQLDTVAEALVLYRDDTGRFPSSAEGLNALLVNPALDGWMGPYVKSKRSIEDPWGRPLRLSANGAALTLGTLGADGLAGGDGADADLEVEVK